MISSILKNKAKQDWNWRPQSIPTCGYACDFDVYWKCRKSLALKKENAQWNEKIQLIHNKFVSFKQARCYYLIMGQNNRNHFLLYGKQNPILFANIFKKFWSLVQRQHLLSPTRPRSWKGESLSTQVQNIWQLSKIFYPNSRLLFSRYHVKRFLIPQQYF